MKVKTRLAIAILTAVTTFLFSTLINRPVHVFLKDLQQPSPWQVLLHFENQDLEGLDEQSSKAVRGAIQQLTGKVDKSQSDLFFPQLFRTITNTSGEKRYILVEEQPMVIIPGETKLRVHIFDTAGQLLDAEEFSAGWRVCLTSLHVRQVPMLDGEALVANGVIVFGGQEIYQAYSLIGNQITLVVLASGAVIDNNNYQSGEIGPKIRRSVDEWERLLMSGNKAEVRAALMWLGGNHRPVEGSEENPGEAHEVELLRSRETVRRRLAELSREDGWIRTMAESATLNQ